MNFSNHPLLSLPLVLLLVQDRQLLFSCWPPGSHSLSTTRMSPCCPENCVRYQYVQCSKRRAICLMASGKWPSSLLQFMVIFVQATDGRGRSRRSIMRWRLTDREKRSRQCDAAVDRAALANGRLASRSDEPATMRRHECADVVKVRLAPRLQLDRGVA